jgi:hypothetical protein
MIGFTGPPNYSTQKRSASGPSTISQPSGSSVPKSTAVGELCEWSFRITGGDRRYAS